MKNKSTDLNFTGQKIFCGIDAHLKHWTVTIRTEIMTHKTFTQPPRPDALYSYLKKHFPGGEYYSAYESGFSGFWAHYELERLGIKSVIANAADIPTTDKERTQKTDSRDSRKIAKSLANGDLATIYIPSTKTLGARSLVRSRSTVVKDLTRLKNRIKSYLNFYGIEYPLEFSKAHTHWSNRFLNWLNEISFNDPNAKDGMALLLIEASNLRATLLKANRLIRKLSCSETYKDDVKLLRTVPGVGIITAITFLTEFETFDRFSNFDKLCSYVGIIPSTKSSGEKETVGSVTKRGHSVLRSAIIESAWVAARIDSALMKCYHAYCKRMSANKAIVKIAKKLLNRIRYVMKNKKPYVCLTVE